MKSPARKRVSGATKQTSKNFKSGAATTKQLPVESANEPAFPVTVKGSGKGAGPCGRPQAERKAPASGQRRPGRPARLSLGLVTQIAEKIGKGMPEKYACLLFGVSIDAFNKLKQRSAEARDIVEIQKALFIDSALDHVKLGGPSANGHRWILQTRHKEFFGIGEGVVIHNENNSSTTVVMTDELAAKLQKYGREIFSGRAN